MTSTRWSPLSPTGWRGAPRGLCDLIRLRVTAGLRACRPNTVPAGRQGRLPLRSAAGALFLALISSAATHAAPAPRILLLDATLAGPDIVAVGEQGAILRSSDSGRTWESVSTPTTATLTGVSVAPDARHGWAVGHDALILSTTDAGRTWQRQFQGDNLEDSFLDVLALTEQHVIALGAYGLFFETQDGGASWSQRRILDEDMHLNRATRGPAGTLYLAGERGTLLRSNDNAATWDRLEPPYEGSFYGVLPLGPSTLLAYGLRGRVFRSDDDGDTWTPIALDDPMLIATALKTHRGDLLLAGQARALYLSHDDGGTFASLDSNYTAATAELLEAPDGTLLAFGEAGVSVLDAKRGLPTPPSEQ